MFVVKQNKKTTKNKYKTSFLIEIKIKVKYFY